MRRRLIRQLSYICAFNAAANCAIAQRPDIPPQAIDAPMLPHVAVSPAVTLPEGFEFGQVASVAVDSSGHIFVLNRGEQALLEFESSGRFVRAFAERLFERAHSLTIDASGDFWITDVAAHTVTKLDPAGNILMSLGTRGQAGNWDEATGSRMFDQPTDVAIGPNREIFVTQGHSRGEPRVLKFDASGRFLTSWGGRGTHPWQFAVAHSIAIDDGGLVYVGDRENRRIQIFDLDGNFIRGWLYRGMTCSLTLSDDGSIYMVTGFDGQIVQLDSNGRVLGVTGRPGEGAGEFGEAHDIAVAANGDIFVADVINRRLDKFVASRIR